MNKKYDGFELSIGQVFAQKSWLILAMVFITTFLTGLFIFNLTPTYQAKLLLEPPLDIELTALNIEPLYFLNAAKQKDVQSNHLYSIFIRTILSASVRKQFFNDYYLPSLSKQKSSQSEEILYKHYLRDFRVEPEFSSASRRFIISVKASNADLAEKQLNDFIIYMNKAATSKVYPFLAQRKKIMMGVLLQQIKLLRQVEVRIMNKNHSLDRETGIKIDDLNNIGQLTPSVAKELIMIYTKNYDLLRKQLYKKQIINLFYFDSLKATITNTILDSKIKTTLIIGVLGGLILGFFISSMSIGLAEKK